MQNCCVAGRFFTKHPWLSPRCLTQVNICTHCSNNLKLMLCDVFLLSSVSLATGLEVTVTHFSFFNSVAVMLFCNLQRSDIVQGLMLRFSIFQQSCDTPIKWASPSSGLYKQFSHCCEINTRRASKKERSPEWWGTWSARLHFRRTVGEKQVGRVQRHAEEGERREVRQQGQFSCGTLEGKSVKTTNILCRVLS